TDLQKRLSALRATYRTWADALARKYGELCRAEGFLPDGPLRQRSIFRGTVANLLTSHPRQNVAYVLVDAMRYEMGSSLASALGVEQAVDARLEARLAECPTDTWLGMNALALDND